LGVVDRWERVVFAVEVITAALAAGAGAGVKDTASAAIRDAYQALKALLKHGFGSLDVEAVQALDADETEPGVWRARIGDALAESGAAGDEEVLAAARRLLALADPDKARMFHIDVETNYGAIGEFHAPVTFNQGPPLPQKLLDSAREPVRLLVDVIPHEHAVAAVARHAEGCAGAVVAEPKQLPAGHRRIGPSMVMLLGHPLQRPVDEPLAEFVEHAVGRPVQRTQSRRQHDPQRRFDTVDEVPRRSSARTSSTAPPSRSPSSGPRCSTRTCTSIPTPRAALGDLATMGVTTALDMFTGAGTRARAPCRGAPMNLPGGGALRRASRRRARSCPPAR
jgi:hypothetical protein